MELPDDCVVHSTRHTFCMRLGESGVGAFEIQRLAGHSSIVISQKCVHPTPALLEHAIGKMDRLMGRWCRVQELNLHGLAATGS
jgi:integrase